MIRQFKMKDYPMLCEWWDRWGWKIAKPPLPALPSTGFISNESAAAFLYLTNSSLCWIEWVVCDPRAPKLLRGQSINEAIEHCKEVARRADCTSAFTSVQNAAFCERLKKLNFKVTDQKMTNLVCVLGESDGN